jgi:Amt family ammonium transporter
MPGHDIPMALAGTFILAFGWFGFNPGSTLAGGDLRIAVVATNTMLAGTGGAIFAMFYVWKRLGKPIPACSPTACSPDSSRSRHPAHSSTACRR